MLLCIPPLFSYHVWIFSGSEPWPWPQQLYANMIMLSLPLTVSNPSVGRKLVTTAVELVLKHVFVIRMRSPFVAVPLFLVYACLSCVRVTYSHIILWLSPQTFFFPSEEYVSLFSLLAYLVLTVIAALSHLVYTRSSLKRHSPAHSHSPSYTHVK